LARRATTRPKPERTIPWGEPKGTTNPQNTWSFATYWQDSNTGLDYANNRYYSNAYGRFMTPDPSTSSRGPSNPQNWNRYAYTAGDPVNRLDPTGQDYELTCGGHDSEGDSSGDDCGFGDLPNQGWGCDSPYVMTFTDGMQMPSPCYFVPVFFAPNRPQPAYLRIVADCYIAGSIAAGSAERDITYQLVNNQGVDMTAAIVTEHLTGNLPNFGVTSSGNPGGVFEDQQSSLALHKTSYLTQTFTVSSVNYFPPFVNQPVFVRGFGGDYGTLSIVQTPTAIYINGDSGLNAKGQPNKICDN
jgi:RHS repeat-associated protein